MRYLVVKTLPNQAKSKLARFAFACDARKFGEKLAEENDAEHVEVLDTSLKKVYWDSRVGTI